MDTRETRTPVVADFVAFVKRMRKAHGQRFYTLEARAFATWKIMTARAQAEALQALASEGIQYSFPEGDD